MTALGVNKNTPLRWPGGKASRALRLLRFSDTEKTRYVEPFGGGLSMCLRAKAEGLFKTYEVSDSDDRLINFWNILRDHPDDLVTALWGLYRRHGMGTPEVFDRQRERLDAEGAVERAVAFYYLNKLTVNGCMNGGMTPTSKRRSGISPRALEALQRYSDLLQGVQIAQKDYRDSDPCRNTFLVLDPPYENVGRSLYRATIDLAEFAEWVAETRASAMVTLNDSPLTNRLMAPFDRLVEPVRYAMQGHYGSRSREATEIVALNYWRPTRDLFAKRFGWTVRNAATRDCA